MMRFLMGAVSACLFSTAVLLWIAPPEGRIAVDRHGARTAMATAVIAEVGAGLGRLSKLVKYAPDRSAPSPVTRDAPEIAALCSGIAREAQVIADVRARGLYSYEQMIADAGDDPVLSWLVTLAWAVVPQDAASAAQERFQTIVARDCARAFA